MKVYQEITLLPSDSDDISHSFLWERLYIQLHLALAEVADSDGLVNVGFSFPKYREGEKRSLGNKIRIFADSVQVLDSLNLDKWLGRLTDYIHVKKVKAVPDKVDGYAFFNRLNDKSNSEKLARRRAKNLGVSLDEARAFFMDREARRQPEKELTQYPFVSMLSLNTKSKFPLTITRELVGESVFNGGFSTYGLSVKRKETRGDSSVPLF